MVNWYSAFYVESYWKSAFKVFRVGQIGFLRSHRCHSRTFHGWPRDLARTCVYPPGLAG